MLKEKKKERTRSTFIGRSWQTFNIGYSSISALISLLGWTTIVGYVLTRYLPSWTGYIVIPAGVAIAAYGIGYYLIKHDIYKHQNAVSSENNPYNAKILGWKDYLGWQAGLRGIEVVEETTKLDIKWFKEMKYDTAKLETNLKKYLQLKQYYTELLKDANAQRKIPDEM